MRQRCLVEFARWRHRETKSAISECVIYTNAILELIIVLTIITFYVVTTNLSIDASLWIVTGVSLGQPESWTQTVSRSLPNFLQGSLGDRPTDKPTDHATRSFTIGGIYLRIKGKERKSFYIAPFVYYVYVKALRHGSHSFTCKYTTLAFLS